MKLFLLLSFLGLVVLARTNVTFLADLAGPTEAFEHIWEHCCGSCHALTALRADWQQQMISAHTAIGFEYVRFHGLFDDDMSVVRDDGTYGWFNVDQVMDFLISIGMRPYVELSYMPEKLARDNCTATVFHYKANVCPPKDWSKWADLVTAFTRHMVDRYGIEEVSKWYFEIWNEPNLGCFWAGTQAEYFTLAKYTFYAVKSVNQKLLVGGPSTAQSAWLEETLKWAASQGITFDFISTHEYPSDPNSPANRDNMKFVFTQARKAVGPKIPLIYSEFNSGLDEPHHDDPFAAAFLVKTALDAQGLVNSMSYWTFSDIFEEPPQNPEPFSQQFGAQTIHGVPKPVWRAFEFLRTTGTRKYPLKIVGNYSTVDVIVSKNKTHLNIIATNYQWVKLPIETQKIDVEIRNFPVSLGPSALLRQIGGGYADPRDAWIKMGKPVYPTKQQIAALMTASTVREIAEYPYTINQSQSSITLTLTLQPSSVSLVAFRLA